MRSYYTDDPVRDAERYAADMEAEIEKERKERVVKCQATIWLTVEHATSNEALLEAGDYFSNLFSAPEIQSDFTCEEGE